MARGGRLRGVGRSTSIASELGALGIGLCRVPPGDYRVGQAIPAPDEDDPRGRLLALAPLLARVPMATWPQLPVATPPMTVCLPAGLAIANEPLRRQSWKRVREAPFLGDALGPVRELEGEEQPLSRDGDPVLEFTLDEANALCSALRCRLPRWYEWEVAARGPDANRYPWGRTWEVEDGAADPSAFVETLTERYSMDGESIMGHYAADHGYTYLVAVHEDVVPASPFGLRGLLHGGREWNVCHDGLPVSDEPAIVRSLCDVGAMAYMVPGVRPNTRGSGRTDLSRRDRTFSGPMLACYAPASGFSRVYCLIDTDHERVARFRYERAAVRLVLPTADPPRGVARFI